MIVIEYGKDLVTPFSFIFLEIFNSNQQSKQLEKKTQVLNLCNYFVEQEYI